MFRNPTHNENFRLGLLMCCNFNVFSFYEFLKINHVLNGFRASFFKMSYLFLTQLCRAVILTCFRKMDFVRLSLTLYSFLAHTDVEFVIQIFQEECHTKTCCF
ncbi:unnamed protein product [Angiostrongylus costaricensis]|uniref:Ovule protein n=1 Tax=Angiostrongylus costaricensis TaxID=334426 RepID=A0A0R3PC72_ANGCS|nr:unnamed protein product [Angiostrongylus costaricensis]